MEGWMEMETKMIKLEKIKQEIQKCKKCKLYQYRKNPVPGEGNPNSEIVFIGEAPGFQEDNQGRPFVGAAGKVLDEMLKLAGIKREEVFITNVIKCRPPNNRDPAQDEILACSPYLDRQIDIIRPKIIVTLGRHSTKYIFSKIGKPFSSILKVHGKTFRWQYKGGEILVFPTLHPAASLYNPNMRKILEKDFLRLKEIISKIQGFSKAGEETLDKYL